MQVQSTESLTALTTRPVVVTGAAGFIGSHLVEGLLDLGADVIGVDDLDPWYEPERKLANLAAAVEHHRFSFHRCGVDDPALTPTWREAGTVFHLAGRPGVQDSWGAGFEECARRNVTATQAVLEATLAAGVRRVVLASSSSVYGTSVADTDRVPRPVSPYGVTKLATEQLAHAYGDRGLPVTCLRYFTVFGPRQRPDMAIHRLIEATTESGSPFVRRGTGTQRREFTYVADVVAATIAAAALGPAGMTLDVGGGATSSLNEVVGLVEDLTGRPVRLVSGPAAAGDPPATVADIDRTCTALGWRPQWSLHDGLAAQAAWHAQRVPASGEIVLAG